MFDFFLLLGAGAGSGSLMSSHAGVGGGMGSADGSIWLAMEAGRNKMDITTLLQNQTRPVNSIDISANVLLCGTDDEAIYTVDLPSIR